MQSLSDEDAQRDANASLSSASSGFNSSVDSDNATERQEICWDDITVAIAPSPARRVRHNNLMDSVPACESDIETFLSHHKKFPQEAQKQYREQIVQRKIFVLNLEAE